MHGGANAILNDWYCNTRSARGYPASPRDKIIAGRQGRELHAWSCQFFFWLWRANWAVWELACTPVLKLPIVAFFLNMVHFK